MEDHKIEVIFRFNIADLVKILSGCLLAIWYAFWRANCQYLFSFSLIFRMPVFMLTAWLPSWPCDLLKSWDDYA